MLQHSLTHSRSSFLLYSMSVILVCIQVFTAFRNFYHTQYLIFIVHAVTIIELLNNLLLNSLMPSSSFKLIQIHLSRAKAALGLIKFPFQIFQCLKVYLTNYWFVFLCFARLLSISQQFINFSLVALIVICKELTLILKTLSL